MSNHIVILSKAGSARSAVAAQSKDPLFASAEALPVANSFLPEAGPFRPMRDLREPRGESRAVRSNPRASGSLPYFLATRATLLLAALLLTALASAQTLTGTVKNASTGKPAAGDEVVLLSLGQGMEEAGRTKADAKGNFSFKLDKEGPHLVRAIHQDVTYHRMAPPGTTSVEVEVYDVAKKVENVEVVADVMRLGAEQGQLEVTRMFAVQNTSKPPRTQMNERNLEFYVPEGAKIVEGSAMTQNGNPLSTMPVPVDDRKTRYAFNFPLRPGTTQFQVAYQLNYDGSANVDPKSVYPLQHFVAIIPKSMQFSPAPGTNFKQMNDPQQPDGDVQVASGAELGQTLAFKVSGEGTLGARQENAGQPGDGGGSAQNDNRPGGGLGPPIDAPDPLQKYRWYILGAFALALVVGGVYIASRQQAAARAAASGRKPAKALPKFEESEFDLEYDEAEVVPAPAPRNGGAADAAPARREARSNGGRAPEIRKPEAQAPEPRIQTARSSSSSMLLEGLKEELFQLEVEHKQGLISDQEYERTKAALDQTLQRALKREATKQS